VPEPGMKRGYGFLFMARAPACLRRSLHALRCE